VIPLLLVACSGKGDDSNPPADDSTTTDDSGTPPPFTVYSPDFEPSAGDPLHDRCDFVLPDEFSCGNGNPELRWDNAPGDTVSFALILDDPDASDFPHWAVYDIPSTATGLDRNSSGDSIPAHILPVGAAELENGTGSMGYYGSCPPAPHVYRWRLWALRDTIDEKPQGSTPKDQFAWLAAAAKGLAYDTAETCHIFNP
jgi:Raf kinase inhibitor-like YbhB/YbcL family protein